jgi:hypothetical protein
MQFEFLTGIFVCFLNLNWPASDSAAPDASISSSLVLDARFPFFLPFAPVFLFFTGVDSGDGFDLLLIHDLSFSESAAVSSKPSSPFALRELALAALPSAACLGSGRFLLASFWLPAAPSTHAARGTYFFI